jgi:hypothetical protein
MGGFDILNVEINLLQTLRLDRHAAAAKSPFPDLTESIRRSKFIFRISSSTPRSSAIAGQHPHPRRPVAVRADVLKRGEFRVCEHNNLSAALMRSIFGFQRRLGGRLLRRRGSDEGASERMDCLNCRMTPLTAQATEPSLS